MATRATIRIAKREAGVSFNEHNHYTYHTQIYHHYDGYPEHLGVALAEFVSDTRVVNGIPIKTDNIKYANGLGDLAAQILVYLKLGIPYERHEVTPGNVYLDKHGTERCDLDYTYYVWADEGKDIWISIFDHYDNCLFVGTPEKLINKYKINTNNDG